MRKPPKDYTPPEKVAILRRGSGQAIRAHLGHLNITND